MFYVSLLHGASRFAVRSLCATGPTIRYAVRLESTKTLETRRQILERRDDMQRDWDGKEISYEQLKPKTLQPTSVSVAARLITCPGC